MSSARLTHLAYETFKPNTAPVTLRPYLSLYEDSLPGGKARKTGTLFGVKGETIKLLASVSPEYFPLKARIGRAEEGASLAIGNCFNGRDIRPLRQRF